MQSLITAADISPSIYLIFVSFLWRPDYLREDVVYIKFVGYNFRIMYCHQSVNVDLQTVFHV